MHANACIVQPGHRPTWSWYTPLSHPLPPPQYYYCSYLRAILWLLLCVTCVVVNSRKSELREVKTLAQVAQPVRGPDTGRKMGKEAEAETGRKGSVQRPCGGKEKTPISLPEFWHRGFPLPPPLRGSRTPKARVPGSGLSLHGWYHFAVVNAPPRCALG